MSVPVRRASAAIGLVGVLVLTGCSGGSTDAAAGPKASSSPSTSASTSASTSPSAASVAANPHVGDCWNSTPALVEPFAWNGGAAVNCASTHTAVTFAVGTLPSTFDYAKSGTDGDAEGDARAMGTRKPCSYLNALKSVGHDYQSPLRLHVSWYGPTEAEYAAGARWYRCDIQVNDGKGYQVLAKDLQHAIKVGGRKYVYCESPKPKSKVGECTAKSAWLMTRVYDTATSIDQPYPGKQTMWDRAYKLCGLSSSARVASWPSSAKKWHRYTLIWCWRAI